MESDSDLEARFCGFLGGSDSADHLINGRGPSFPPHWCTHFPRKHARKENDKYQDRITARATGK